MEVLKRSLKFQYEDTKKPFCTFWAIALLVYLGLNIFINADITTASGMVVASMIFLLVDAILIYSETFPLMLGLGSTRKDFYISSIISYFIIAFIMSIIQSSLFKVEEIVAVMDGKSLERILIFNGNMLITIIFFTILAFAFTAIFNIFAIIVYKIGAWAWTLPAIFLFLVSFDLTKEIFIFITKRSTGQLLIGLFAGALLLFAAAWPVIKRLEVKKQG